MFYFKIITDLLLIKQNIMVKTFFVDIAYNAFLAEEY